MADEEAVSLDPSSRSSGPSRRAEDSDGMAILAAEVAVIFLFKVCYPSVIAVSGLCASVLCFVSTACNHVILQCRHCMCNASTACNNVISQCQHCMCNASTACNQCCWTKQPLCLRLCSQLPNLMCIVYYRTACMRMKCVTCVYADSALKQLLTQIYHAG